MCAATELLAPTLDEFSLVIEDHHAVWFLTGGIYRVMDVNVPLRVFADSMSIAILNVSRKFAPVVRDLICMLSGTKDWFPAAGFIRSPEYHRRYKTGAKPCDKFTT